METTWIVTEADRDEQGKIKVQDTEPRSLADLLPKPETIKQDAARQRLTRQEAAGLAVVALLASFVLVWAKATPDAPPAPPRPAATTVPTLAPTVASTAVPTAAPTAIPTAAPTDPPPAPVEKPVAVPVAAPVPCTRDIAPYVVTRQVQAGTLPIGEVSGWSCTSAAEAEANASAQEQQVRASYQATVTTKTSEVTR